MMMMMMMMTYTMRTMIEEEDSDDVHLWWSIFPHSTAYFQPSIQTSHQMSAGQLTLWADVFTMSMTDVIVHHYYIRREKSYELRNLGKCTTAFYNYFIRNSILKFQGKNNRFNEISDNLWQFPYQRKEWNRNLKENKMCLWNTNAPDNGQFQQRPRSQGQIFWYQ